MTSLLPSSERIPALPFIDRIKSLTMSQKRPVSKTTYQSLRRTSSAGTLDKNHALTTINTVQQSSPPPPPYVAPVSGENDIQILNLADKLQPSQLANAINKSNRTLDRKSIIQGIKLVAIAADEYEDGNDTVALDIYLTGIDKIVMALPGTWPYHAKDDMKTKLALEAKLIRYDFETLLVEERVGILNAETKERYLLASHDVARHNKYGVSSGQGDHVDRFRHFAQYMINLTVAVAILIKQSPIPDILYFLFGSFVQFLIWMDARYHLVERTRDLAVTGVKLILQVDEEYHLHQVASETMYMVVAAGLKAAVAFKESPSYQEVKRQQAKTDAQSDHQ
ncbi:hypothetical protein INT43_002021 [Umbelopsis isabellina]|uniref:Uncharacterized protein n=1 Tax=Mortierella isabellina TaxID=91625 RepID=A0A8H7PSA4_MORIS|nr:hypothetical protein INT43_002021 [Umbelopsis isabellina]